MKISFFLSSIFWGILTLMIACARNPCQLPKVESQELQWEGLARSQYSDNEMGEWLYQINLAEKLEQNARKNLQEVATTVTSLPSRTIFALPKGIV